MSTHGKYELLCSYSPCKQIKCSDCKMAMNQFWHLQIQVYIFWSLVSQVVVLGCEGQVLGLDPEGQVASRRQHRLPVAGPIIGFSSTEPSLLAHNLGVFIDSDLLMEIQVKRTASCCFGTL